LQCFTTMCATLLARTALTGMFLLAIIPIYFIHACFE
jgi:hypothetical protein